MPETDQTLLQKKLQERAQSDRSARGIADEVASSSEATADIFSSRYTPPLLRGKDQGADQPDGVITRFATR